MNRPASFTVTGVLAALLSVPTGCGDDIPGSLATSGESTAAPGSSGPGTTASTEPGTTNPPPVTSTTDSSGDNPTDPPTTGSSESSDDGTDTDTLPEFQFDDSPPDLYAQVDRMGVPAVNAALVLSDAYNEGSPEHDMQTPYEEQMRAGLLNLHSGFDPELKGTVVLCELDVCMQQVTDLAVPDALRLDLTEYAGFPNGRIPNDPVMDMMFGVALLDLSVEEQDLYTLVGLGPTSNDMPFSKLFPYFPEGH